MPTKFLYSNQSFNYGFILDVAVLGSLHRAMFTWITAVADQDPINTSEKRNQLIAFCVAQGVDRLFLDMYTYLGSSNYTVENVAVVQQVIAAASAAGITVYALAGNTDWSIAATQAWVQANITENIMDYNAASTANQRFAGMVLDVEYWTDGGQTATAGLSGLCDLVTTMQTQLELPVACFAPFYLSDGSRPDVTYNTATKSEGEHLMDVCDFVIVGAYRDTAELNVADDVAGQIALFQDWYDYALSSGAKLYLGSETISIAPEYITYFEETKTYMETQLDLASDHFTNRSVMLGHAIHSYDGWKAMS